MSFLHRKIKPSQSNIRIFHKNQTKVNYCLIISSEAANALMQTHPTPEEARLMRCFLDEIMSSNDIEQIRDFTFTQTFASKNLNCFDVSPYSGVTLHIEIFNTEEREQIANIESVTIYDGLHLVR